eukprot:scaffold320146_cov27-Attheya_sp.AAC.1
MLLIVESNRSCLARSARAETSDIKIFIISNRCCPPLPASLTMVTTTQMMRHPSIGGHTEQAQHITISIFYTRPTIMRKARGLMQCSSLFDEPEHANWFLEVVNLLIPTSIWDRRSVKKCLFIPTRSH